MTTYHQEHGTLLIIAAIVLVPALIYHALNCIRKARLISMIPRSTIRAASQGYCKLLGTGQLMAGDPIVAPLSQTPCLWYSYKIRRRSGEGTYVAEQRCFRRY